MKINAGFLQFLNSTLMRAELATVNHTYALRKRFKCQCPVDSTVTTANDYDVLVAEVLNVLGEVVNTLAFQVFDAFCTETGRLECANTGSDDDGAATTDTLTGLERKGAILELVHCLHLLAEANGWVGLHRLLKAGGSKVFGKYLRETDHVVNVLLGIHGRTLSTGFLQRINDLYTQSAEASVEGSKQPGWAGSDYIEVVHRLIHELRCVEEIVVSHRTCFSWM